MKTRIKQLTIIALLFISSNVFSQDSYLYETHETSRQKLNVSTEEYIETDGFFKEKTHFILNLNANEFTVIQGWFKLENKIPFFDKKNSRNFSIKSWETEEGWQKFKCISENGKKVVIFMKCGVDGFTKHTIVHLYYNLNLVNGFYMDKLTFFGLEYDFSE